MTQVLNNQNQESNNQGGVTMTKQQQDFINAADALRVAEPQMFIDMVTNVYGALVPQTVGTVTVCGQEFPINAQGNVVMEVAAVEAMLLAIKEPVQEQQAPVQTVEDMLNTIMGAVQGAIQGVGQVGAQAIDGAVQAGMQAGMQAGTQVTQAGQQRIQSLIEQIAILERKITNCMTYGISVNAETLQLQALKVELDTLMGNNLTGKAVNMVNATGQYVNNTIAPVVGSTIQSTGNLVGDLLTGLLDAVQGVVNEVMPVATSVVNSVVPVAGSVVNAGIGVSRVATNFTVNSINSAANTAQTTTQTVGSLFNIK